jgi:16S rRNA processing protein RimM
VKAIGVPPDWSSLITVGYIVRPHGHRGQVVVAPETDFADERFAEGAVLFTLRAEVVEALRVVSSREFRGRWVVGFDAVTSMDEAEALRDLELRIASTDLHALDPGSYYVHELVGCRVETTAGRVAGLVTSVHLGPGAPILEVGGEVLVPFIDAICRRVDLEARVIVIDPPGGLLGDDR